MAYPEYFLKVHQPDQAFPAVCRCPGRHSTGECMVPVASRSRRSGVPASAGSGVPGRLSLSRQAFHRRMHGACCIPISPLRSPGFSRTRRSQPYIAVPAGIPPANAWCLLHPDLAAQESRLQPDLTFPAVYRCPGRHSTGSSRDSRSFHIRVTFSMFMRRDSRSFHIRACLQTSSATRT